MHRRRGAVAPPKEGNLRFFGWCGRRPQADNTAVKSQVAAIPHGRSFSSRLADGHAAARHSSGGNRMAGVRILSELTQSDRQARWGTFSAPLSHVRGRKDRGSAAPIGPRSSRHRSASPSRPTGALLTVGCHPTCAAASSTVSASVETCLRKILLMAVLRSIKDRAGSRRTEGSVPACRMAQGGDQK